MTVVLGPRVYMIFISLSWYAKAFITVLMPEILLVKAAQDAFVLAAPVKLEYKYTEVCSMEPLIKPGKCAGSLERPKSAP